MPELLIPDWQLPPGIVAAVSRRGGGESQEPWTSFNLAAHVGDDPAAVKGNRLLLHKELISLSHYPALNIQWLQQVHGKQVFTLEKADEVTAPEADALYTSATGVACAVLTADCLPVLFCSADGREIAVAHAGWRGLLSGVLENTLDRFTTAAGQVLVWLGPAIGPCHFEVGQEVRDKFIAAAGKAAVQETAQAFTATALAGKYMADLYRLATIRLAGCGVNSISGQADCSYCHAESWYSFRRDGETGRFATLIMKCP